MISQLKRLRLPPRLPPGILYWIHYAPMKACLQGKCLWLSWGQEIVIQRIEKLRVFPPGFCVFPVHHCMEGSVSDTLAAPWRHQAHGGFRTWSYLIKRDSVLNLSEESQVRYLHYLPGKFSIADQRLRGKRRQIKESALDSSIQASLGSKRSKRRMINLASNPEVGYLTQLR